MPEPRRHYKFSLIPLWPRIFLFFTANFDFSVENVYYSSVVGWKYFVTKSSFVGLHESVSDFASETRAKFDYSDL